MLVGTNNQLVAANILSSGQQSCSLSKGFPHAGWGWGGRVQLMRENAVAAAFYTKNRGGVLAAAARSAGMESNSSDDGGNQCSVQQHDSALSATSSLGNRGCVSTFRFAAGGISLAPPTPMVCSSTALMGSVSAQLRL